MEPAAEPPGPTRAESHSLLRTSDNADTEAETENVNPRLLEGMGRLTVEATRGQWIWLHGVDMYGDPEQTIETIPDTSRHTLSLATGDYTIWWGRNHLKQKTDVRIQPGKTTRVRLESLDPMAGRGRVDFSVEGLDGKPIKSAGIWVRGASGPTLDWHHIPVTAGHGTEYLRPGRYQVHIGHDLRWIHVVSGQTSTVEFRYRGFGELRIDRSQLVGLFVLRADGAEQPFVVEHNQGATTMLYVKPGAYDVVWYPDYRERSFARRVGVATVRAGERTQFKPRLPTGSIQVFVEVVGSFAGRDECWVNVSPGPDPGDSLHGLEQTQLESPALSPGTYRVWVAAEGCHLEERRVEVADRAVRVEVVLHEDPDLEGRLPEVPK
ncbi:MAG: hypothetical protein V3T86_11380 [Planctomycetota bacterium]